jgi:RNA exonuclease 1
LVTGHSDPVPMRHLNEKRLKWERLVKTLGGTDDIPKEERWMAEDDRELEAVVNKAREGMAFFCVK